MIRKRIKDANFDNITPQSMKDASKLTTEPTELSEEKSKKGLGEVSFLCFGSHY